MSTGAPTPEMKRRFDAAEKIRIGASALARPALQPTPASLRAHFRTPVGRAQEELENPHFEPRLAPDKKIEATPASVLIAVLLREQEPTVLVTRRPAGISFPGHWVFPGGRADPDDADPIETALREAEEEVGLRRDRAEVLGRLGDYYSHSGFRIAPTVALMRPPFDWQIAPAEVESVEEIPLRRLVGPAAYFLFRFQDRPDRAHFALSFGPDPEVGDDRAAGPGSGAVRHGPGDGSNDRLLTGVTVSLCIGLYRELLKTHV